MSTSMKQDAANNVQQLVAPPPATKNRLNVSKALAKAYEAIDDQSSIVTQVCNSAMAVFKGKPIAKHDMEAIVDKVAELRNWSDKSKASRASEVRAMLSVYDRLPNAIDAYRKKAECDKFTWHNAVTLARHVRSLDSVDDAVTQMLDTSDKDASVDQVRKTFMLTADEKKTYDQAIEMAKLEAGVKNADAAFAAIIEWYVESHAVAKAA